MATGWQHCANLAIVEGGDRVVVLRLGDETSCEPRILEGTAASVWSLLDGVRSVDTVVEELLGEYGGSPDAIRPDVVRFVEELARQGFLEPVDSVSAGLGEKA